jgi:uncharacterized protein YbjT (DUF2867 family)
VYIRIEPPNESPIALLVPARELRVIIMVTGASGFIGQRLVAGLAAAGHRVLRVQRQMGGNDTVTADFMLDLQPEHWVPRLTGVEVVVNAVGILRQTRQQTFECIHARAPQALFAACLEVGVRRIVQISALGAREGTTEYFRSKRAADVFLEQLLLEWTIIEPSLIYGPQGTSAQLFNRLASLPVMAVPGRGEQAVQPIHIDDFVGAVVKVVASDAMVGCRVPIVGPEALTLVEFLRRLRATMGLRRVPILRVPLWLMKASARVAGMLPRSLLDLETLQMLEARNTASPEMTEALLQRRPRGVEAFIDPQARRVTATAARLQWLLPLLRLSLALVWIWTGVVSFGLYPIEQSYTLLADVGLTGMAARVALYGAAALDLLLGILTVGMRKRRVLWLFQLATILAYTTLITVYLPDFWLHPYGPILKNLPLMVAIYALYVLEEPP